MKFQLMLIGAVAVLSLGAVTLTDAMPVASASHGRSNQPSASPSTDISPSPEASDTPDSQPSPDASPGVHPCNHGFYVSQAAHAHKGGAYTSSIAQSDLGKNGDCSAPLPTPKPAG